MGSNRNRRKPLIGITLGDPSGIGPEVVLRALADRRAISAARFAVFGSGAILDRVAGELRLPRRLLRPGREGGPSLVECGRCSARLALLGRATAPGGAASVAWIESAVRAALDGRIEAVVTAPISKEAIHKAGYDWPGHTEMIAEMSGVEKPVMMMAGGGLRVALVTTHAAIADLPRLITKKNALDTLRVMDRDLRKYFGLPKPRIAVCGLNPHSGEAGRFGMEEKKSIAPAIRQARQEGIVCDGPIPADVAFTPDYRKEYDAVVAMYHDQATIPVKMLAFHSGVNVTLGLPIIRTSPDHGTAYDIVRKGKANPGSMIAAILLAAKMARRHG
jgi:4-hydroxythreonine-4-phosphate dehydrogenase